MTGHWRNQSKLVVEILPDGRNVELTRPFIMHRVVKRRLVDRIEVPEGTVTNFASIPRWMWLVLSPTGRYNHAACVHDYLYESQERPRNQADAAFRQIMESSATSPWRTSLLYIGVRLFGWWRWNRLVKEANAVLDSVTIKVNGADLAKHAKTINYGDSLPWDKEVQG